MYDEAFKMETPPKAANPIKNQSTIKIGINSSKAKDFYKTMNSVDYSGHKLKHREKGIKHNNRYIANTKSCSKQYVSTHKEMYKDVRKPGETDYC